MTSEKVPFCFQAIRRWYADSVSGIVFNKRGLFGSSHCGALRSPLGNRLRRS
jgi:hypothetical protein